MRADCAVEAAPAKINLDLFVTGQRMDGYHELDSLVVFTAFGDRLHYQPADRFSLEVDGPFADATPVEGNIVLRAADLLRREFPDIRPLRFRLSKYLPVASGIGGGSSDAAAAMRAIVRHNAIQIDDEGLRDIGATLGADIPVCLYARSARMRGTGLRLDPVRGLPELSLVLVNPGAAVTTAEVFRARQGPFSPMTRPPLAVHSSTTGLGVWLKDGRNDLQAAATVMVPEIQQVIDALAAQDGALVARMSGSGATCYGLFTDAKRADRAANLIGHRHPDWWVVATRSADG